MGVLRLVLLAAGVVGVLVRPRRWPAWTVPVAAVLAGLATGAIAPKVAGSSLRPLASPLVFLVLAVPLAVLLDRAGFFAEVAARIPPGRHLPLALWALAAAVTTLFNLDASVVLLTPLYVRLARRHGLDPVAAAFPPVLLACFASSALPVSNLTNLLAAERFGLHAADVAVHLGPASVAAVVVGYLAYRRTFPTMTPTLVAPREPVDVRAWRIGVPVVLFVLVGFTVGDRLGVPAWAVAAIADVALMAVLRSVPWRVLPAGAVLLAGGLAVLAGAAAPELGLGRLLGGAGAGAWLRVGVLGVVGANLLNNLPALLVALPALGPRADGRLWAALVAVNMGPALAVTGSLAGLLWLDTTRRLGVPTDARAYTRVGVRVGAPALAAAFAVLLVTNRLAG